MVFYTGIESGTKGRISPTRNTEITGVYGETQELGQFVVRYANTSGTLRGMYKESLYFCCSKYISLCYSFTCNIALLESYHLKF